MAKRKKKGARAGRKKAAPKRKAAKKAARSRKASGRSSRKAKSTRKSARKRPQRPAAAAAPRASAPPVDDTAMEAELLPELEGDNDRMEFP